nr:copia protein [Tanacetum cinerariifolium]
MPLCSKSEVDRLLAIPTPPLSPVSPTSYPLPLLLMPLPIYTPLPTSSFPLPSSIPSTSGSESIPEANIPLRKRARFTTHTSRYEIGESSVAAATRQIRPTLTIADKCRADDKLIGRLRRESILVTQMEALRRDVSTLQRQHIEHSQRDVAPEDGDRLQVKQKQDRIFISQDKYVAKILRKFGLTDGKLTSTPIDTKKPLLKDLDDSPFNLVAYSDSDYARASLDRKSTTGGCQFLGYRLISWQCKKQTVIATSSTEAEYVANASCCAQVLWIQNHLLDYRKKVIITEDSIRQALRLDDVDSVDYLPNEEIFVELARMGYEKPSKKLTFYKAFFSA